MGNKEIKSKEEKDLLLSDLCARLPYGVKGMVKTTDGNGKEIKDDGVINSVFINEHGKVYICIDGVEYELEDVKSYLRPMSSMTEEEKNELRNLLWFGYPSDDYDNNSHRGIEIKQCLYDDERHSIYDFDDFRAFQTFLLKNHIDYRGLIPMGLALPAKEGMYND